MGCNDEAFEPAAAENSDVDPFGKNLLLLLLLSLASEDVILASENARALRAFESEEPISTPEGVDFDAPESADFESEDPKHGVSEDANNTSEDVNKTTDVSEDTICEPEGAPADRAARWYEKCCGTLHKLSLTSLTPKLTSTCTASLASAEYDLLSELLLERWCDIGRTLGAIHREVRRRG